MAPSGLPSFLFSPAVKHFVFIGLATFMAILAIATIYGKLKSLEFGKRRKLREMGFVADSEPIRFRWKERGKYLAIQGLHPKVGIQQIEAHLDQLSRLFRTPFYRAQRVGHELRLYVDRTPIKEFAITSPPRGNRYDVYYGEGSNGPIVIQGSLYPSTLALAAPCSGKTNLGRLAALSFKLNTADARIIIADRDPMAYCQIVKLTQGEFIDVVDDEGMQRLHDLLRELLDQIRESKQILKENNFEGEHWDEFRDSHFELPFKPVFLLLDEAGRYLNTDFFPRGSPAEARVREIVRMLETLTAEARKYGFYCLILNQNPRANGLSLADHSFLTKIVWKTNKALSQHLTSSDVLAIGSFEKGKFYLIHPEPSQEGFFRAPLLKPNRSGVSH